VCVCVQIVTSFSLSLSLPPSLPLSYICFSIDFLMKHFSDIDLYGFCPERDDFYGVVCEICDAIVKPQALIQHIGIYNIHILLLH